MIQGEKDIQILAKKDTPLLVKALKSRVGLSSSSYIVPSASHNLKAVKNENLETGFSGPVVPSALKQITEWLKRSLR